MRYALLLAVATVLAAGCETYRTQFGTTQQAVSDDVSIRRLDLSHRQLLELPPELDALTRLRMLNLSGNPDLDLGAALGRACRLPRLNTLLLDDLALTTLPGTISACQRLAHISLAQNPDLEFADAFAKLAGLSLMFINLSGNQLERLPAEIELLATLRDLRLSHNRLHAGVTYEHLAKLPALYSLWLDHNRFEVVPSAIGKLRQIRYLFLDHNTISALPDSVASMRRLKVIHLNHNRFADLPEQIITMPGLLMAFISSNQIKRISPRFADERYFLRGIVLDENCLSSDQAARAAKDFRHFFMFSAAAQRGGTCHAAPRPEARQGEPPTAETGRRQFPAGTL